MSLPLEHQLMAMRAHALAVVAEGDAVLAARSVQRAAVTNGVCQHPEALRRSVATMGAPTAWLCACGAEGV